MISSYRLVLLALILVGALNSNAQDSNPIIPLNPSSDGWYTVDFSDPRLLQHIPADRTDFGDFVRFSIPPFATGKLNSAVRRCLDYEQETRCYGVKNLQGAVSIGLEEYSEGFSDFSLDVFSATPRWEIDPTFPPPVQGWENGHLKLMFSRNRASPLVESCILNGVPLFPIDGLITVSIPRAGNFQHFDVKCSAAIQYFVFDQGTNASYDNQYYTQRISFKKFSAVSDIVPDLAISSLRVGQVLWQPGTSLSLNDVTLVKGKTSFFEAIVNASNNSNSEQATRVAFKLGAQTYYSDYFKLKDIPSYGLKLPIKAFVPLANGDFSLQAFIDQENVVPESNEGNNSSNSIGIKVRESRSLKIGVIPSGGCGALASCYPSADPTAINSQIAAGIGTFLEDILPVPNGGLVISKIPGSPFVGSSSSTLLIDRARNQISSGMFNDLIALDILKKTKVYDRVMLSVNRHYFDSFHFKNVPGGRGTLGFTLSGLKGVGIYAENIQYPKSSVLAHELLHTFQKSPIELYDPITMDYIGQYGGGVSASKMKVMSDDYPSVLGPVVDDYQEVWIDRQSYAWALQDFLSNQIDPEILVVSGLLNRDGTFSPIKSVIAPEGFLSNSEDGGTLVVQAKNGSGQVLSSVSVAPSFLGRLSYSGSETADGGRSSRSIVELPAAPISVALPYSKDIQSVSVVNTQNGKVLFSVEPKSMVLEDAVSSIPNIGFKACAILEKLTAPKNKDKVVQACGDSSRKILLVQIQQAKKHIERNNPQAAKSILNSVKREISLLVSDYVKQNELEPSKEDIINLIAKFINEL